LTVSVQHDTYKPVYMGGTLNGCLGDLAGRNIWNNVDN